MYLFSSLLQKNWVDSLENKICLHCYTFFCDPFCLYHWLPLIRSKMEKSRVNKQSKGLTLYTVSCPGSVIRSIWFPLLPNFNIHLLSPFREMMDSLAPWDPRDPLEKRSACAQCTVTLGNTLPWCHYYYCTEPWCLWQGGQPGWGNGGHSSSVVVVECCVQRRQ